MFHEHTYDDDEEEDEDEYEDIKDEEDYDVENDDVEEEDDDAEGDDFEEEDGLHDRDLHCAQACEIEMHSDISQEPFMREFTGHVLGPSWSTLIKYPPLHLQQETVSVDTLFGEYKHILENKT